MTDTATLHPDVDVRSETAHLYGTPPSGSCHVPFHLVPDPLERLLVANFDDDLEFNGIELQVFADPIKGEGMAVLMYRTDGKIDWYMTPGLHLDREAGEVGAGIGHWISLDFPHHFEITSQGVQASVEFVMREGRQVIFDVQERRTSAGPTIEMLAPLGHGIEKPTYFPFFYLYDFDLVRRRSTGLRLVIGGKERTITTLPMPLPYTGHRAYLMRYGPDAVIVRLNPAFDGTLPAVDDARPDLDVVNHGGYREVSRMTAHAGAHEVRLEFEPAFPELVALARDARLDGRFELSTEVTPAIVQGNYRVARSEDRIEVTLQPSENWHPAGSMLVRLTLGLFPRFFRTWPRTFAWKAVLDLSASGIQMTSGWERTEPHKQHRA